MTTGKRNYSSLIRKSTNISKIQICCIITNPMVLKGLNLLKSCLNQGIFPGEWKKAIVVPVYEKGDMNVRKTTDQFLFFQCLAKHLKDPFITLCLNIF